MAGLFEQFDSQKNKSSGGLFAEFDPQKNKPSGGLFAEFMKPSWTDPTDSLPPVERDRAIQRRRSKMGANNDPNVITEVEQPKSGIIRVRKDTTSPTVKLKSPSLQELGSALGQTAKNIGGALGNAASKGLAALQAGAHDIGVGLASGAQTIDKWLTSKILPKHYDKYGYGVLFGDTLEGYIYGQEQQAEQSQAHADEGSGAVSKIFTGALRAIPRMTSGLPIFAASSAGGYARDAENEGANLDQQMLYGTLGGATETLLERALGVVPGVRGLKNTIQGGVKGLAKTIAGEAFEEGITDPILNTYRKLIYKPDLPVFSTTEDAVINPVQMGQSALSGGVLALMLAPFGMGGQKAPIQAEQQVQQPTDFTPIGGNAQQQAAQQQAAPTAEAAPIGGKQTNIPQGEKLLSFPQTMESSDTTAPELKQMIKDNPLSYQPINNPDTLKMAQQIVDQNFEAAKRIVMEGESFSNAIESAMAQDIIRRLQNERKWNDAFDVMEATARKAKASGQAIQAFAMWRRMTPEGMLKYAHRVINQAREAGAKNAKLTPEFADRLTDSMERINQMTDPTQLQALIKEQAGKMPKWTEKMISKKTTEQLKDIAIAQVLSDIADQVPSSAWKKLSAIQAFSHLINARTAGRNIFSNISFGIAEKLSNIVATPIDFVISKFTGERSLTLPQTGKESVKAGIEQAKEAAIDIALGINRTGVRDGKYNVPRGKTFKKGAGRMAEKLLGYELVVPDEFFKGEVFYDVLQQQMKVEGLTQPTQEMIEYAQLRARYATFQDDSLPARILQGLKDLANKVGGGQKIRGTSGMMTREAGAGDLLIKYTTVPGNLIARSVEYTPMGMFKILSLANNAKMSGKVKQSEIAMTIGRSIVGTTCFIGLGALLKHLGLLISEDRDRGKNATALDRAEGLGNYKVNMSAFGRLVNGKDPTPQYGDHLVSYNWLEPVGVTLAVGATIYDETHKDGTIPEIAFNSANAAMEEILDLPTLSVIRQMTYQDNVFDRLITPFVQGVSGFIPGPVRQIAQMIDPVARETKGATPVETIGKRIQTSIPLWREGLEPKIAPFGGEIEYPTSVWNSLLNPGQTSTYTPSTVTEDLKRLEDITGSTTHYPREKAPKSFNFNSVTYELTPEEKTLYMRTEGEALLKMYERILANGYTEQTAAGIVKALESAKSTAHEIAKREILRRRGIIR